MYELIYAGKEAEDIIKSRYPEAKITDASDCIHPERFELEVDTTEDEFYPFAIKEGFGRACFTISLLLESLKFPESGSIKPKESKEKLERWLRLSREATNV